MNCLREVRLRRKLRQYINNRHTIIEIDILSDNLTKSCYLQIIELGV